RLPERSMVDVRVLMAGSSREAVALPGLGRELLEGVQVETSPGFAAWLLGERRRLQALGEAVLREGSLRAIAAGDPRTAVNLATRLVAADPLNEDAHALLIRAFAATSDEVAVKRQLAASIDLFRRELGVEPGSELADAARMPASPARAGTGQGRAAIRAMIESGEAAVEAAACLALGTALVHAAKGKDEEGAAALHRCIAVAEGTGRRDLATSAHRELGYVEVLRGDFASARTLLSTAERLAGGDPAERAKIEAVLGVYHADKGALEQGAAALRRSIELSESTGQAKQTAWSMTVLGRTQLQRGEIDVAEETLERGRALARVERWTAFLAFPEALLAEVWFRRGELDRASEAFEHASALGTQVNDACWEAYGVRGLGLLRAAEGDLGAAIQAMDEAL